MVAQRLILMAFLNHVIYTQEVTHTAGLASLFNHPQTPVMMIKHITGPAAGWQAEAPLSAHGLASSLPLKLPASCLSVSVHSNLTN